LADEVMPEDMSAFAQALFGIDAEPEIVSDAAAGVTRLAFHKGGRLVAALFAAEEPVSAARDFVADALGGTEADLLAARPGAARPDPGPIVCSCMSVGRNTILGAIEGAAGADVDRVCVATGAGTNCGSCRPEIADLVHRALRRAAAE
ncbi:MAG: (2Fe-2S)-binding protein, partial [Pseudomonadota bacterium]